MMLSFSSPEEPDAVLTLGWRTKPRVTQFLVTDIPYDRDSQERWLATAGQRTDYLHWIVRARGVKIGLASLSDIDLVGRSCSSGFYVGEDEYVQLGWMIPAFLHNFVFLRMPIDVIGAQVLSGNDRVLALNLSYGFKQVRFIPNSLIKDGVAHDVHVLELRRDTWLANSRFRRYVADLPVTGPLRSIVVPQNENDI